MPNHGVEIIDGIPVHVKDGQLLAFQPSTSAFLTKRIKLGQYDAATKKAIWQETEEMKAWLTDYQANLVARSRK
jgi:hypothetical protein